MAATQRDRRSIEVSKLRFYSSDGKVTRYKCNVNGKPATIAVSPIYIRFFPSAALKKQGRFTEWVELESLGDNGYTAAEFKKWLTRQLQEIGT